MIFFRVFGNRSDPMAMLDFSGELSSVKVKVVEVNDVQASRKATLLDHLAGQPKVNHNGQITVSGSLTKMLIIPTISIVTHSIIAFYFLFLK